MRILQIHNRYQQAGGEDQVVSQEGVLLERNGHSVMHMSADNAHIVGLARTIRVGWQLPYSRSSRDGCAGLVRQFEPEVAHVHNLFPVLTPSVLDALEESSVPVVMTLHNYRLICAGASLMRGDGVCTTCITSSPYVGAFHRCYRRSLLGSLSCAHAISVHRKRGTWARQVHRFIALTEFGKGLFVEAGLPRYRILVKPNYCAPAPWLHKTQRSGALFVGRLSREKGIATLESAWRSVSQPLRLVGSGLYADPGGKAPNVSYLGQLHPDVVFSEMGKAEFLVMPSECFEGFPVVIAEAFSNGLPVLASKLGAMAEIVEDGVTGLHFEAGDPQDLAAKAQWLFEHPDECRRMGLNARAEYERKYTPERNYEMLMDIYEQAIHEAHRQYGES